jgi:hypothetical protein
MARFYADENFDYPVTERLRRLGHDVLTVQEAVKQGGDDAHVLAVATQSARIVLTFDRQDFKRLHRTTSGHEGIISCTWGCRFRCLGVADLSSSGRRRINRGNASAREQAAVIACLPEPCGVPNVKTVRSWKGRNDSSRLPAL